MSKRKTKKQNTMKENEGLINAIMVKDQVSNIINAHVLSHNFFQRDRSHRMKML